MAIDLKRVERKLGILTKAQDYTSDRAAARSLGISHSTIFKYRRQLRAETFEESLQQLGTPLGRPRRRPLNCDRNLLIWWIRHENPKWSDTEVAAALRGMKAGRIWAKQVSEVSRQKPRNTSIKAPPQNELDFEKLFQKALERYPLRFMYLMVLADEAHARSALRLIALIREWNWYKEYVLRRLERKAKVQIQVSSAMKAALREKEGKGCSLEELLQMKVKVILTVP